MLSHGATDNDHRWRLAQVTDDIEQFADGSLEVVSTSEPVRLGDSQEFSESTAPSEKVLVRQCKGGRVGELLAQVTNINPLSEDIGRATFPV